jgi:fatty aldehyde-generating acyl-ACP reductase
VRRFAFVIHPLRFDDFARKFPLTRYMPPRVVEAVFRRVPPLKAAHVTGVVSEATGNSYTTATAVDGALQAALRVGIDPAAATVAVVGATGSIGTACCHLLAEQVPALTLVARRRDRLDALADTLRAARPGLTVAVSTDIGAAVRTADIVIAVSSSPEAVVRPEDLKPGAVVCDVARPRNLSRVVTEARPDVLVIDGGVIAVPGEAADLGMDFGLPPRMVEACMAETMALALEGRRESFTLGPTVDPAKVRAIRAIAARHGFRMAGFRRFERAIPDAELDRLRHQRQSASQPSAVARPRAAAAPSRLS